MSCKYQIYYILKYRLWQNILSRKTFANFIVMNLKFVRIFREINSGSLTLIDILAHFTLLRLLLQVSREELSVRHRRTEVEQLCSLARLIGEERIIKKRGPIEGAILLTNTLLLLNIPSIFAIKLIIVLRINYCYYGVTRIT